MSDRRAVLAKIKKSLAHIIVLKGDEVISEGSGFSFLPGGEVLTAAHTIAGGWPVKDGEIHEADRQIIVRFVGQGIQNAYRPAICPITITLTSSDMKPITLDIGIIVPATPFAKPVEHLVANINAPAVGDDVFLAGYSDEVAFPFGLDRLITATVEGVGQFRSQYRFGIKTLISGPMIKRGMVGNVVIGSSALGESTVAKVSLFYVDNQMHSGASGGPIVDAFGEARGIIIQRSQTSIVRDGGEPDRVPGGSTIGIGLDILQTVSGRRPLRSNVS